MWYAEGGGCNFAAQNHSNFTKEGGRGENGVMRVLPLHFYMQCGMPAFLAA